MQSPFIREWEDEVPVTRSYVDTALWEGVSPFLEIPSEQQFFNVLPDFGKIYDNWKEKIGNWKEKLEYWTEKAKKNTVYANRLGWSKYSEQISELLLKTTGQSNKDHTSAHFAFMVALWQEKNGFSGKDVDGVIGPNTWKKMQPMLGIKESIKSGIFSVNHKTVLKVQQYSALIERKSYELGINPNIVRGIIAAESGGNPESGKGRSGYKGLMQAGVDDEQLEPGISIKTGIGKFIDFRNNILNRWLKKLGINVPAENNENYLKACLSCYNAGPVTALKAIQYAHTAGDWQQWLSPSNYLRALVFSGGYAQYSTCSKGAKSAETERAKAERLKYRFKTSNWRSEPDPAPWNSLVSVINPIMRCWIETKFKNTPGYLNKFILYFKYFEGNAFTHEIGNEVEQEDMDQFFAGELYEEGSVDKEDMEFDFHETEGEEVEELEDDNEIKNEDDDFYEDENFDEEYEGEEEVQFQDMGYEQEGYSIELDFEDEIEYEELYDDEIEAEMLLDYEFSVEKEPLGIPVNNPVSFAPIPKQGSFWPLISTHSRGKEVPFQYQTQPPAFAGNGSRSFLAKRANGARYHVGIDLYANNKDKIVACEDGVIINFYHFYRSTYALILEHENIVINYGEVHSDSLKANKLKVGDRVRAGQVIGFAGKMYKSSMLHFETYIKGTIKNIRWLKKDRAPNNILNPTKYLLFLQQHGKISNGAIGNTNILRTSTPTTGSNLLWRDTKQQGRDILTGILDKGKLLSIAIAEISNGERNENKITNSLFYAKYPSQKGQKLQTQDPLAKDWINLRNSLVRPLLENL